MLLAGLSDETAASYAEYCRSTRTHAWHSLRRREACLMKVRYRDVCKPWPRHPSPMQTDQSRYVCRHTNKRPTPLPEMKSLPVSDNFGCGLYFIFLRLLLRRARQPSRRSLRGSHAGKGYCLSLPPALHSIAFLDAQITGRSDTLSVGFNAACLGIAIAYVCT